MGAREVIQVLLVDDHKAVRDSLRGILTAAPYVHVAGEAEDGTGAVRLSRELAPDLILMDVSMPGLSGIEATRLIVAATAARVLMLSLHADAAFAAEALGAGACGYVVKTRAAAELLAAIEMVMGGGRYVGTAAADE